jgi:hypothetical protein
MATNDAFSRQGVITASYEVLLGTPRMTGAEARPTVHKTASRSFPAAVHLPPQKEQMRCLPRFRGASVARASLPVIVCARVDNKS